jgi:outer membrane lipoprotein-sorting protein
MVMMKRKQGLQAGLGLLLTVIGLLMCIGIPAGMGAGLAGASSLEDGARIVRESFNHMRGKSSVSTVEMIIHRPDWERRMTLRGWTKGEKESIFRITAPPRDRGNGTLKKGSEMWTYSPKINRVIKLPPSMMSQSWMGSDFSNNDLAKSDSLLHDYDHYLEGTETHEGRTVYVIRSEPRPRAPVIWGMQRLKIREDQVLLEQVFYDEDRRPVKRLASEGIQMMSGRMFPRRMTMQKVDEPGSYTAIVYKEIAFLDTLPDRLFTITSLRTVRR